MKNTNLRNSNFVFFLLALIFFAPLFIFSYNPSKNNNVVSDVAKANDFGDSISFAEVSGISNILLLSSDARPNENYSRADSIMILTIDNVNKKLKVTSLLRDMLVSIDGHGEEKLNHSFAYGGPLKTIETIENNFGIRIDNYIIIDFNNFRKIVDTLGGITLDIKDYEVSELNKYILDSGGSKNDLISSSGTYTLNGYQALSYARIRKVGDGEYERSSRQRTLINLTLSKIKNTSPIKIAQVVKDLFPYINTNVNLIDALNYSLTTISIYTKNSSLEQFRLPIDNIARERLYPSKGWVFVLDKEENSKALKDFIFNDKIYTPNTDSISDIAKEYDLKYGKKKR